MNDLNVITIIGRLTKKPEIKQVAGDLRIVNFSIACNGRKKEETYFFDCVCFGKVAEVVDQYCDKGSKVAIEGRLQQQRWEKDGIKKSKVEIVVNNLQFLDTKVSTVKNTPTENNNPFSNEDIPF